MWTPADFQRLGRRYPPSSLITSVGQPPPPARSVASDATPRDAPEQPAVPELPTPILPPAKSPPLRPDLRISIQKPLRGMSNEDYSTSSLPSGSGQALLVPSPAVRKGQRSPRSPRPSANFPMSPLQKLSMVQGSAEDLAAISNRLRKRGINEPIHDINMWSKAMNTNEEDAAAPARKGVLGAATLLGVINTSLIVLCVGVFAAIAILSGQSCASHFLPFLVNTALISLGARWKSARSSQDRCRRRWPTRCT